MDKIDLEAMMDGDEAGDSVYRSASDDWQEFEDGDAFRIIRRNND